jgi:cytochrome b561
MSSSYSAPLRVVHWLMAAIIFAALGLGVWASYLPHGTPLRAELLNLHKSFGLTALALIVLRVIVRHTSPAPAYVPALSRLNRVVAASAHGLLYLAMIALPVSGYIHSAAGGHDFYWFGLFPTPDLIGRDPAADKLGAQVHYVWAWGIGALLGAHLLAVAWHVIRRDRVLQRMWP